MSSWEAELWRFEVAARAGLVRRDTLIESLMSDEEQYTTVGRLVLERLSANRQIALLDSQVAAWKGKLGNLHGALGSSDPDEGALQQSSRAISELERDGGLGKLRQSVDELLSLRERVSNLNRTLKNIDPEL